MRVMRACGSSPDHGGQQRSARSARGHGRSERREPRCANRRRRQDWRARRLARRASGRDAREGLRGRKSGFSTLTDIHAGHGRATRQADLRTFSTGVLRGHEGSPLVIGSSMYVVTPFPNVAYAFDLSKPGAPLRWKFRPVNAEAAISEACCDVVNRGAAYADGTLYYNLLGWPHRRGRCGYRCRAVAHACGGSQPRRDDDHGSARRPWQRDRGAERWRDGCSRLDRRARCQDRPRAMARLQPGTRQRREDRAPIPSRSYQVGAAVATSPRPAGQRAVGCTAGGAVWGWLTYDPKLNLLYYGTSNPGPWIGEMRPGDNKYTSSILARDPDTGELRWALQVTPHDLWDYDAVNENILADLPIHGQLRQVLVHFDRNGFAYTIDRQTGEVLVAASFVPVNWASGIDLATGRPRVNPDKVTGAGRTTRDICPSLEGGKNPAAGTAATFSPGDRPLLRPHEQPVHGLHWAQADVHRRHALHRRRRAPKLAVRAATAANSLRGTRRLGGRCGASRSRSRCGAGRSRPRATSSSTGRSGPAGSRPLTPRPVRSALVSQGSAPGSLAIR